jgi:hypothetical protein
VHDLNAIPFTVKQFWTGNEKTTILVMLDLDL